MMDIRFLKYRKSKISINFYKLVWGVKKLNLLNYLNILLLGK